MLGILQLKDDQVIVKVYQMQHIAYAIDMKIKGVTFMVVPYPMSDALLTCDKQRFICVEYQCFCNLVWIEDVPRMLVYNVLEVNGSLVGYSFKLMLKLIGSSWY